MNTIKELIAADPAIAFQFDERKQSLIHWAAKRGNLELLNIVFRYNKNPNVKDILGRTPLYLAAKYGNIRSVKYLLGMNSNVFLKCNRGLSAIDVAENEEIKLLI